MIMAWSQDATEPLLENGDFLMSQPVQEYLAMQSFVPASAEDSTAAVVEQKRLQPALEGLAIFPGGGQGQAMPENNGNGNGAILQVRGTWALLTATRCAGRLEYGGQPG
jgi:hypothetical protein